MTTTSSTDPAPLRARPAALLLVDVDEYPVVRRRVGHAVAEEVLASVATLLRDCAGAPGSVRRCGADGFLVLLPGAGPVPARRVAEHVRAAVADLVVPVRGSADVEQVDGLAVSIGGAVHQGAKLDVTTLLWAADAALYATKRGRGDAVRIDVL